MAAVQLETTRENKGEHQTMEQMELTLEGMALQGREFCVLVCCALRIPARSTQGEMPD